MEKTNFNTDLHILKNPRVILAWSHKYFYIKCGSTTCAFTQVTNLGYNNVVGTLFWSVCKAIECTVFLSSLEC